MRSESSVSRSNLKIKDLLKCQPPNCPISVPFLLFHVRESLGSYLALFSIVGSCSTLPVPLFCMICLVELSRAPNACLSRARTACTLFFLYCDPYFSSEGSHSPCAPFLHIVHGSTAPPEKIEYSMVKMCNRPPQNEYFTVLYCNRPP